MHRSIVSIVIIKSDGGWGGGGGHKFLILSFKCNSKIILKIGLALDQSSK